MKHIVSFSSGLSSALTVERVIARYGAENTQIVFMDTTIEDSDNYRFLDDMRARWSSLYGADLIYLRHGKDPYMIAQDAQIIPNQKIAPCTMALKIKVFTDYLKGRWASDPLTIHIGYDFTEEHRCEPTRRNYEAYGWEVDFPLLWKPIEFRPYPEVCRRDWNVEPPRMYAMGFTHANCGKKGCVKQGQGDWIRTLINFPEGYHETEEWEQMMRQHPLRKDYALVRDQTGGEVKALTLRELRERYEAGKVGKPELLDFHAGCLHCGVGDLVAQF